jgi:hypothetical protein
MTNGFTCNVHEGASDEDFITTAGKHGHVFCKIVSLFSQSFVNKYVFIPADVG